MRKMNGVEAKLKVETFSKGKNFPASVISIEFTMETGDSISLSVFLATVAVALNAQWYFPGTDNSFLRCSIGAVCLVILGALIVSWFFAVAEEKLLLAVPIRLQATTTYLFGTQKTLALPWSDIGDFMIIDEIIGQKVLPFLAVQLKKIPTEGGPPKHIILFRNTRPRLHQLERMYKDLQSIVAANRK